MFKERILNLSKRLFPRGRAFRIPFGSTIEKVMKGLAESENTAFSSAISLLDSILPDNDNFSIEDAENWERRLGLISNSFVSLVDRKAAIQRKMNHPGTIKARQHYLYMERELRAANFDVYVVENRFPLVSIVPIRLGIFNLGEVSLGDDIPNPNAFGVLDPNELLGGPINLGTFRLGEEKLGGTAVGAGNYDIIANHLDPVLDANYFDRIHTPVLGESRLGEFKLGDLFDYQDALRSTFFIGGTTAGSFALMSSDRLTEFRQLVQKLKPVQTVGFTFLTILDSDYNDDYNDDYDS